MTTSNHEKMLKQLEPKPAKHKKFIKHNKPKERACGIARYKCKRCGRYGAHINKYGLHLCRSCFRDMAKEMGFKKFD